MLSRPHVSRMVIVSFIVIVVFAFVYAIKSHSITGIILSLTSLGATIHFLSLLAKAKREFEQEEESV